VRFLVDQQLPSALAVWLRSQGQLAEHVRDIGLRDATDAEIWEAALQTGAVIVSKDEDFVIRRSVTGGPQILWLRMGNVANAALLGQMAQVWIEACALLENGEPIVEVR
jgi:predicted nuclease of predicted toxin-antitoxin system